VAIDGSEHADKALNFALDLAERYSAAHYVDKCFSSTNVQLSNSRLFSRTALLSRYNGRIFKEIKASHEKILSKALKRAKELKPDLKISTVLKEGRPADEIVKTAKEENFDLIVMGHRGLGRVKEFFLGSVSDRVADEAHCPVLIVK